MGSWRGCAWAVVFLAEAFWRSLVHAGGARLFLPAFEHKVGMAASCMGYYSMYRPRLHSIALAMRICRFLSVILT